MPSKMACFRRYFRGVKLSGVRTQSGAKKQYHQINIELPVFTFLLPAEGQYPDDDKLEEPSLILA